ncbi:hypothetical protein AV530_011736 [Patagioenas fasciata monilis]|uniref:Uncharacterized protein n=1 Tax=Patagioenas fasciata monilis TaxID=372326 RepID=A0A1V4KLF7_PATFA|nr:hypothetical protein AV530_011736 [Patagioenas fasciata monilis]
MHLTQRSFGDIHVSQHPPARHVKGSGTAQECLLPPAVVEVEVKLNQDIWIIFQLALWWNLLEEETFCNSSGI